MTDIHPTAARGFDAIPDLYERARPGYPAAAVEFMIDEMHLRDARVVVDVAAGTGKFTRELVVRGISCTGVEPVEGMRAKFERILPDVPVVDAAAEHLPFDDGSVDAITVAQAFHWFASAETATEFARVLRPGGTLGLVWNARDDSIDWVARVTAIFKRYEGADGIRVPRLREAAWRVPLTSSPEFEPVADREFAHSQTLTPQGLLERVASVSFIAVLPQSVRARALTDLRSLIETHPELRGRQEIEHPYITETYVFRRTTAA